MRFLVLLAALLVFPAYVFAEAPEVHRNERKPLIQEEDAKRVTGFGYNYDNSTLPQEVLERIEISLAVFQHGSGFLVSGEGLAVTNSHVLEFATRRRNTPLMVYETWRYKVTTERVSAGNDLSIVRFNPRTETVGLPLNHGAEPSLGETLYGICPVFLRPVLEGIRGEHTGQKTLSGVGGLKKRQYEDLVRIDLKTALPTIVGCSGGPVVNKDGVAVGMIVGGFGEEGYLYMIPIDRVIALANGIL
jgi:S1-C subfamily serine protease